MCVMLQRPSSAQSLHAVGVIAGVDVFVGDPGRQFLQRDKLTCEASYALPAALGDQNYGMSEGVVWRLSSGDDRQFAWRSPRLAAASVSFDK